MDSTASWLILSILKDSNNFFEKPISFLKQTRILNALRSFTTWVAIYGIIATFSELEINQDILPKNSSFLKQKSKFWTFREFFFIRVLLQNCYNLIEKPRHLTLKYMKNW